MMTLNFQPFPELTTDRLYLRPVKPADERDIFFLRTDDRVMKYLDRPKMKDLGEARDFIQKITEDLHNNKGITWAICLKGQAQLIGTICYWRIVKEHYRAEIGYSLHPDFQGKGIMQEAIGAVMEYGFGPMNLHSIEANVNPGNVKSMHLLERNRFVREAYFRENYYFDGQFLDSAIYSCLKHK